MDDVMMVDNIENDLELLIGTRFEHHGVTFEVGSILRKDSNAIVYEARTVLTAYCEHILKVYRSSLSDEELSQQWASHCQCAAIVGNSFLEGGFFQIGEWTVRLQRRSFEAASATRRVLPGQREHTNLVNDLEQIADLCNNGEFAKAAQKCDMALLKSPMNSHFLRVKGIALFGMGESRAANDALELCFQVDPDEADHYAAVMRACVAFGQAVWARKWAGVGISRVRDRRLLYKTWFEAEVQLEQVQFAGMCLRQLRLLEEPEDSLEEFGARLEELQQRLVRCAQDVDEAFRLFEQRQLEKASQIADRLLKAYPHHVPAMHLAAVWAIEEERWPEAIFHLRRAFTHEPLDNPDIPRLLGHVYRKLGKPDQAAIMHAIQENQCDNSTDLGIDGGTAFNERHR